jgi:hypothetical protein
MGKAISTGFGVFIRDRTLRAVTAGSCVAQVGAGAAPVAVAVLAADRGSASATGVVLSAAAVGGLLGSGAYARWPLGAAVPERVVLACLAAAAMPFAVLAAGMDGIVAACALFAVWGILNGPQAAALFVVRDRRAPAAIHAQVFATGAGLKMSSGAVGAALAGVAAGMGAGWLLAAIAAANAGGAILGATLLGWGFARSRPD